MNFEFLTAAPGGATHVFWYNALKNGYHLQDCNPGPCLPGNAVVHEGSFISGNFNSGFKSNFTFGAAPDRGTLSAFIWSEDLNLIKKGKIKSAVLRGEYCDSWVGDHAMCSAGSIRIRCGVLQFSRAVAAYGGADAVPGNAEWLDTVNMHSDTMGFDAGTRTLAAETTFVFNAPPGRQSRKMASTLDGRFFEINVTRAANWILQHPAGQYGMVFLVDSRGKNPGRVSLFSAESYTGGMPLPKGTWWTIDGNTCHLVLEEDPASPLQFYSSFAARNASDSLARQFSLLFPAPFTVIRTDTLTAGIADAGFMKEIVEANYFLRYFQANNGIYSDTIPENAEIPVGTVRAYPYRILLNCSKIPDQNIGRFILSCEVQRKRGADTTLISKHLVLDRNTAYASATLFSAQTSRPVRIDGSLADWKKCTPVEFSTHNNRVTARSLWDTLNLYVGMEVQDHSVISHYFEGAKNATYIYTEDETELFIEPSHARKEIRNQKDFQAIFAAAGMASLIVRDSVELFSESSSLPMAWKTVIRGKPNDSAGDTGYIVECAIPWKALGKFPALGASMGFELWNVDIDASDPKIRYSGSWSGVKAGVLQNPSEWGSIVLVEKQGPGFAYILLSLLAILVAGGLLLYYYRKRILPVKEMELSRQNLLIGKAGNFIQEHFKDPDLNREKIAAFLNISAAYLGNLYKKNTGKALPVAINEIRIKYSENLLMNTNENITKIGFESGFGTLEHFSRIFKEINGVSPNEFRKAHVNHSKN